jgi:hypothetical protein
VAAKCSSALWICGAVAPIAGLARDPNAGGYKERPPASSRYPTTRRVAAMNVRTNIPELDRIRRDVGARLRIEHEVAEPPPRLLMALLKELESMSTTWRARGCSGRWRRGRTSCCARPVGSQGMSTAWKEELPMRRYRLDRQMAECSTMKPSSRSTSPRSPRPLRRSRLGRLSEPARLRLLKTR